ncbi:MAG: hypothetical protein HY716_13210 [Planctomycetes bacterium]|nr:hypothetical protein [Planctomycetota bacterium]
MIPKQLLHRLSVRQLQDAIRQKKRLDEVSRLERQFERHQREAAKLRREIDRMMDGAHAPGRARKRRRRLSAEARRKLSEAAKRRWAKVKGAVQAAVRPLKRRQFSAEGLKRIADAARRRWEKYRAEKRGVKPKNPLRQ